MRFWQAQRERKYSPLEAGYMTSGTSLQTLLTHCREIKTALHNGYVFPLVKNYFMIAKYALNIFKDKPFLSVRFMDSKFPILVSHLASFSSTTQLHVFPIALGPKCQVTISVHG